MGKVTSPRYKNLSLCIQSQISMGEIALSIGACSGCTASYLNSRSIVVRVCRRVNASSSNRCHGLTKLFATPKVGIIDKGPLGEMSFPCHS